jgi:hypothetical protein
MAAVAAVPAPLALCVSVICVHHVPLS